MALYNRINKEELKIRLMEEDFKRTTISFYKYFNIAEPQSFRDDLYRKWDSLHCFGRIYIAREGINAQMSIPQSNLQEFLEHLDSIPELFQVPIKYAVEDDGKSFYKLTIKVRPKIVADGLDDGAFDTTNVGKHLTALEFHEGISKPENLVIDMRNHYESEIGKFENAVTPDVVTFKEEIDFVVNNFSDRKDQKIFLYCTGGVRCEKASAYLRHHGFKDVNQLYGGVIEYAQQIKKEGLKSKFIGSNFVFDERLSENIDGTIISHCHQCGKPSARHTNCANKACHLLFIQCEECAKQYHGSCSTECKDIVMLPEDVQKALRKGGVHRNANKRAFSKSRHGSLMEK
jgi:UPF0176 protein